MAELSEDTVIRWSLLGDEKQYFLSAMSKLYTELNKVGFNDRAGLTRNERMAFNDVVEQIATKNFECDE